MRRPRGAAAVGMLIGIVIVAVLGLAVWAGLSPSFRQSLGSTVECMISLGQRCGHPGGGDTRVAGAGPSSEARAGSGSSLSANDVVRFVTGQVPLEQQLAAVDRVAQRATDLLTRDLDKSGLHADDREVVRGFVDGVVGLGSFVAKLAIDPVGTVGDAVRPWVTDPLGTAAALWNDIVDRPYHALGSFVGGFGAGKLLALPLRRVRAGALASREARGAEEGCVGGVCSNGRTCFAAGTLVDTADGPRAIETIVPGELVRSRDPDTGVERYQPVTRAFVRRAGAVEALRLVDPDGAVETITVTPEHPFFVDGRGWVAAAALRPGPDLVRGEGPRRLEVAGVVGSAATTTVYNLEVAGFHTYFVGHARAWVHNQCRAATGWNDLVEDARESFGRGHAGVLDENSMRDFVAGLRQTAGSDQSATMSYRWVLRSDGTVGYMSDRFMQDFYNRNRVVLTHQNIGSGPKGWFTVHPTGVIVSYSHLPGSPQVLGPVLERLGLPAANLPGRMVRLADAARSGKSVEAVAQELGEPLSTAERNQLERAAVDVLRHSLEATGRIDSDLGRAVVARQEALEREGVHSAGRAFNILAFGPHDGPAQLAAAEERALRYWRPGASAPACVGPACTGATTCFAAGTLVDTADGPRAIETIVPGELVRSRDPQSGVEAYKPVRRTFVTAARPVEQLELADGSGAVETITVTPEHPFFVDGRGWVSAADLDPVHDTVRSAGGTRLAVVAALMLAATSTVYNLEVDDFHTYFVGRAQAWVHNQCQRPPPSVREAPAPPYVVWARAIRDPSARNPFFDAAAARFTQMQLQRQALIILQHAAPSSGHLEWLLGRIRQIAAQKLPHYDSELLPEGLAQPLGRLAPGQQTQAALEYSLATFSTSGTDTELRHLLLDALKLSPTSDYHTVELLMPLTRGVFWAGDDAQELVLANDAITQITARLGHSYVSEQRAVENSHGGGIDAFANAIINAKSVRVESMGGGVNDTKKVTFFQPNGGEVKAVWKSLAGSRPVADGFHAIDPASFRKFVMPTKEARAPNVYGLLLDRYYAYGGHAPIHVPATVEGVLVDQHGRSLGVGSFQEMLVGYRDLGDFQWHHWHDWEILRRTPEWREAESVVRTLDYIVGNTDRFPKGDEQAYKNVMIKVVAFNDANGHRVVKLQDLALIDNGLGLPGPDHYHVGLMPVGEHVPHALKQALASLSDREWAEFVAREQAFIPQLGLDDVHARLDQALRRLYGDRPRPQLRWPRERRPSRAAGHAARRRRERVKSSTAGLGAP